MHEILAYPRRAQLAPDIEYIHDRVKKMMISLILMPLHLEQHPQQRH